MKQSKNLKIMNNKKNYTYKKEVGNHTEWFNGLLIVNGMQTINAPEEEILKNNWIKTEIEPPHLYSGNKALSERSKIDEFRNKYPEYGNLVKPIRNSIIYHYTTWDTLFNGILNETNVQNGYAVLRAYSVSFLNDDTEGLLYPHYYSEAETESLINQYGKEKINKNQIQRRQELLKKSAIDSNKNSFSVSFSLEKDSLPMWNYYGYDGKGICIGFDAEEFWNQGYELYACIYNQADIEKLSKCDIYSFELYSLFRLLAKDNHFAYEKECRIMLHTFYPNNFVKTRRDIFYPISYAMKRGYIVPYVNLFIPTNAIKEIVIGPTNNIQRAYWSLDGWLRSLDLNSINIIKSNAPIAK